MYLNAGLISCFLFFLNVSSDRDLPRWVGYPCIMNAIHNLARFLRPPLFVSRVRSAFSNWTFSDPSFAQRSDAGPQWHAGAGSSIRARQRPYMQNFLFRDWIARLSSLGTYDIRVC